jgi:hypothetical protein
MIMAILPVGVSAATEKYVEFTVESLGLEENAYTATTNTVDGVDVEWIQLGNYGNGIQMRDKDGKTSMFWNNSAVSGKITKIEFTYSDTKNTYDDNYMIVNFGKTAKGADCAKKLVTSASTKSYEIAPDGDYKFFYIEWDTGYSSYWKSIKVYYEAESGNAGGNTTPSTPSTPSTPATPGCVEFTVETLGLEENAYTASTNTVGGIGVEWIQLGNYGSGIQMRDKDGKTSMFWNTSATPGKITKIEFTYSDAKKTYDDNYMIVNFGKDAKGADCAKQLVTSADSKSYEIVPDGDYNFFYIEWDTGYSSYWNSIKVYYEGATGGNGGNSGNTGSNPNTGDLPVAGLVVAMMTATAGVVVLAKKKEF